MSSRTTPSRSRARSVLIGLVDLLRRRGVRLTLAGWAVLNVALVAVGGGHLPLHASTLAEPPTVAAVLSADAMFLEVFALMGVVWALTRHRSVPDLAARAPTRPVALRETVAVLGYGGLAMAGGYLLGRAFGWHAFGLHLANMVIRGDVAVTPVEAVCWAGYNLVAYAVVPFVVFRRRRYSAEELSLRSADRRADLRLILVVLALEATVQLGLNPAVLDLSSHQLVLGLPLTFALSFAGTVLPAMVFVYCVLTPRYLALTGSVPTTVILGGLTYALLHLFDGWTNFTSPVDALLSVAYLLLFYTAPGMFKTFLTIRTANAWTHVWAYHAIAPHTLVDTPMFVGIFHLR